MDVKSYIENNKERLLDELFELENKKVEAEGSAELRKTRLIPPSRDWSKEYKE